MNSPSCGHQDFLSDLRLSLEQVGALSLMLRSEGPYTGDWLYRERPSGRPGGVCRSRSQRIIRELKALGYAEARSIRDTDRGMTTIRTSIRGSLGLPFAQVGLLIRLGGLSEAVEVEEPMQIVESRSEIVVQSEVIEAELVDEAIVVAPKKARKPTIAQQTKAIRQDLRWTALLVAYKEMLNDINKIGNLGDLPYAAREFVELVPDLDADPTLLADILASLTKYRIACNGYPVSLKRYVRDRVWENYPPEKETDWSDL